jgi:hypothetical protein
MKQVNESVCIAAHGLRHSAPFVFIHTRATKEYNYSTYPLSLSLPFNCMENPDDGAGGGIGHMMRWGAAVSLSDNA